MAEFKADLNPKSNSMSLTDLLKMEDYLGKSKGKVASKPAPIIDKSTPYTPSSNNIRSDANDVGVPFKFGNNNQQD